MFVGKAKINSPVYSPTHPIKMAFLSMPGLTYATRETASTPDRPPVPAVMWGSDDWLEGPGLLWGESSEKRGGVWDIETGEPSAPSSVFLWYYHDSFCFLELLNYFSVSSPYFIAWAGVWLQVLERERHLVFFPLPIYIYLSQFNNRMVILGREGHKYGWTGSLGFFI